MSIKFHAKRKLLIYSLCRLPLAWHLRIMFLLVNDTVTKSILVNVQMSTNLRFIWKHLQNKKLIGTLLILDSKKASWTCPEYSILDDQCIQWNWPGVKLGTNNRWGASLVRDGSRYREAVQRGKWISTSHYLCRQGLL